MRCPSRIWISGLTVSCLCLISLLKQDSSLLASNTAGAGVKDAAKNAHQDVAVASVEQHTRIIAQKNTNQVDTERGVATADGEKHTRTLAKTHSNHDKKHHPPSWLRNEPPWRATGELVMAKDLEKYNKHVRAIELNFPPEKRDAEAYMAAVKYFWHQSDGISFEMGALDGSWQYAVTRQLLGFGWHRILVEASPRHWKNAAKISKDATYIGAAICTNDFVHYLQHASDPTTNGIAEFMTTSFLSRFFKRLADSLAKQGALNNQSVAWNHVEWSSLQDLQGFSVTSVPCVQLKDVFSTLRITHINLFILDVEGAEISVLESIDFNRVIFDVICVETMAGKDGMTLMRPAGFAEAVSALLTSKGYEFDFQKKRNSWFHRSGFVPRPRPDKPSQG